MRNEGTMKENERSRRKGRMTKMRSEGAKRRSIARKKDEKTEYNVDFVALKQRKLNHEFLVVIRKKQIIN